MTGQKRLRKLSDGLCPKGCKGRLVGEDTYCVCLESKLPKLKTRTSINASATASIERFPEDPPRLPTQGSELDIVIKQLEAFGLKKFEVDLIVSRFFDQKTMKQIVTEQRWTSIGAAEYHLRTSLTKLRKGGFSL